MSLFTTRVELHKSASSEDHDKLHKEMEKEGFWRTISLEGENIKYHLPTAEYNYGSKKDNSIKTKDVMEKAKKAAKRTNLTFGVLVTKVAENRRYWEGLEEVEE